MLGLGLGLSKGKNLLSNLKLLTRNSDWAIWGDKATGISKGTNSPQVNPIQDLVGNADGTLQGFGFIPTSGYVDVPIKGVGDEISYSNLVTNGDFVSTTGWSASLMTIVASFNKCNGTVTTQSTAIRLITSNTQTFANTKRYHASFILESPLNTTAFIRFSGVNSLNKSVIAGTPTVVSTIITGNGTTDAINLYASANNELTVGTVISFSKVKVTNLDDNPQVQALESKLGRQLTVAECDYLFDFTATTNTIKVKVVTGIQGDGANDVILLPSNAPNPVGLQDFGFAFVFKTPSTFTDGYLFSRNLDSTLTMQVGIFVNGVGSFGMYTNATPLIFGNDGKIVSNKFYKLIITRKSGVLTCKLLDETTYSQPNVISLISRPNARMFARSNSVDGSANSLFSNVIMLYDNYNNGTDIDAWEADQNKAIAKIYGL